MTDGSGRNIGSTAPRQYLSSIGAWALAFGCSVGWGSFVMPGNTFLPIAGPLGTAVGIGAGALVMMILGLNYHYMMNRFPGRGGTFTYTKRCFGYDAGFLNAWFLIITYIAIIWANATALPLIARTLLGDTFQFGFHYEIAGFQVYMGELFLAMAALAIAAGFCLRRRLAAGIQVVMAILLFAGIVICFVAAMGTGGADHVIEPPFAPENEAAGSIFTIFSLAPWAFVGFESISHSAGEAKFPLKRSFIIFVIALITGGLAYILLALLASTTLPEGCSSWVDYVSHLDEYSGIASQPTFFAAYTAMGGTGAAILGIASLCGIFTGLIGNYIALSRLLGSMTDDGMLPGWFGRLNRNLVPGNAILCIMLISFVLPFFGRTAISWIVDVTTVGATIAYAFASASTHKLARQEGDARARAGGIAGMIVAVMFAVIFLIPNLLSVKTLSTESYLILAIWGILGFLYFFLVLRHDTERRLGRSVIAWVVLLGLIIFTSSVWMIQSAENAVNEEIEPIHSHYSQMIPDGSAGAEADTEASADGAGDSDSGTDDLFLEKELRKIDDKLTSRAWAQVAFIVIALIFLFLISYRIQRREREIEVEKMVAEESSRAKTSFLSNMSHEIRTPMNAIIGLDNIALKNPDLSPKTREQLEKIGASANHLLGLINDILDMSRIESGRMALKNEEFSLQEILNQVNIIINGQCEEKGLRYECRTIGRVGDYYYGDDLKLKQVLINILGNSVKFTEPPGSVTLTVEQAGESDGMCTMRFSMQDTGVGMDAEYIPRIFDAFSQEDATTTNQYGGSGLGMAITKNFVDMMKGEIHVESERGVGSVFTVTVPLQASDRKASGHEASGEAGSGTAAVSADSAAGESAQEDLRSVLAGSRVLMAEDVEQNAEILEDLLDLEDISAEIAENGQIAVDMFSGHEAGYYDAILMDMRMPVMDGLDATRTIRALDRPDAETIPIIAMTANVFDEDVRRSLESGMNAHLGKPIEPEKLYDTLAKFISESRN